MLSKGEKDEMIERLWDKWEKLNIEYQNFTHKKTLCEITKERKLMIESRMMQLENLIDSLHVENICVEKRGFKFE